MIDSILLAATLLASSQQATARGECRPLVTNASSPSRSATAVYYEQARDSIAALYPRHRLLAERRSGQFGRIEYSLVAYQSDPTEPVTISLLAVDWEARRSWSLESSCRVGAWPGGLIEAIVALGTLPGQTTTSVAALVEAVRSTVAREIDQALPLISFDEWVTGVLGSQVRVEWEVNDCGEQTGNPALDRGRDFPTCVQLRAELTGGRSVLVMLSAGSQRQQPAGAPGFHSGVVIQPGGRQLEIRRPGDLPSMIGSADPAR
jgi:hypothetical protein